MPTRTALLATLAGGAALLAAAMPAAAATPAAQWSKPAGFTVGGAEGGEPVPRAAIASDGTSAVVFESRSGALMLATGARSGRFGAARVIERTGVRDYSLAAAPGGAFLVVWEDRDGLRAAVRTKAGRAIVRRRFDSGPASEINGVQVAADPRGGWVVAQRIFPHGARSNRLYGVRALSLDPAARQLGAVQDLGVGEFGIDARSTQSLAVDPAGRAVLAFKRENAPSAPFGTPAPVVVATRPHGGAFSTPVALPGPSAADPRVVVDGAGRALVAVTQTTGCGDAGCSGTPAVARVRADGSLSAPLGPRLRFPGRAFAPSGAFTADGAALVFQLKTKSEPFSTEAPVRAVAVRADGTLGPLQTLTSGRAKEPVVVPVGGGRVLTVWSGMRGIGAALSGADGVFRTTAEPKGPPPMPYHSNSTNRDLRSAGRYAIFTWARAGRVRVAVRRF